MNGEPMNIKAYLSRFAVFAAALLVVHWVAVILFFSRMLFPPPLVIGIDANLVYVHPLAVLVISAVHVLLFALMNAYLFLRVARGNVLSPRRAGLPSLAFTLVLALISLRYWLWPISQHPMDGPLGGVQSGLQIQGPTYIWCYGVLNLAGFALAAFVLYRLMKRSGSPSAWLVYNWALYVSLFVLVLPWLGGYP